MAFKTVVRNVTMDSHLDYYTITFSAAKYPDSEIKNLFIEINKGSATENKFQLSGYVDDMKALANNILVTLDSFLEEYSKTV